MIKKIMIVDDDPDILLTLRIMFEKQHFEVFTVDSGNDCIKELEKGFQGIVLVDIIMPFMNGIDTIKKIIEKNLQKNIILSIITASGINYIDNVQEIKPYIHDFIYKPFDLHKLSSEINYLSRKDDYLMFCTLPKA
jgi:DNA-binding NtrC family response regulator